MPNNLHTDLAKTIVKHQESIIGPLAWNEAGKVSGLKVNGKDINITGDGKKVLENLVKQYQTLFGQASVEACKDAVKRILPKDQESEVPAILL